MNPIAKYFLSRAAIFAVVAVPLMFFFNVLNALAIGLLVSMVIGFTVLRRQQMAMIDHIDAGAKRRQEEKRRLRAELAGDDA
jgi:MFS superfamily sulfate permease-like transporter